MSESRSGTDIRIEYDEDGGGWFDPYSIWLLEFMLTHTAQSWPAGVKEAGNG